MSEEFDLIQTDDIHATVDLLSAMTAELQKRYSMLDF